MSRRFTRGRVLIFLLAVVVVGTAVTMLVANNREKDCVHKSFDFVPEQGRSNGEAFAVFIAEQEESPLPLSGWTPTSETADESVYTSEVAGHWEVKVSRGAVREYSGCPD